MGSLHAEDTSIVSPPGATPALRGKLKQRRSRKACQHCHTRKIRCNVLESGTPCSNCVDAGTNCVIRRRKNQRRDSTPPHEAQQAAVLDQQSHSWRVPTPSATPSATSIPATWIHNTTLDRRPSVARVHSDQNGYSVQTHSQSSGSPNTGDGQLWQELQPSNFAWDPSIVEASSASCDFSHLTDLDDIFTFTGNSFMPAIPTPGQDFPLPQTYPPQHLSPTTMLPAANGMALNGNSHIPPRRASTVQIPGLNPRDQEYLRVEGCFELLPPHVLKPMMRMYFRMVHPNLPIVAEDQFWALWNGDEFRVGDFSYLLLRAMVFAATSYTELETLSSVGFVSKREARNTHYRHAKLLFDFGIERDPVANAQACLLLSYNAPNYNLLRLNTYWVTNAIRFAKIVRADSYYRIKDPVRARLLKRIWWGVIFRDRILSLGLRRSTQVPLINDWETDKHILTVDDFQSELGSSLVHDTETQLRIFEMVGTTCRLMQCLTHASRILYTHERLDDRLEFASRSLQALVTDIQRALGALRHWHDQAIRTFPFPISLDDAHETICVYANMMFSYHASAVFGLNTYLILLREVFPASHSLFSIEEAREAMEVAHNDVSRRTQELVQVRLVKYLPISASAVLALPLILQAINVAAARGSGMEAVEIRRLDVFTRTLKSQQQNFDGSDFCADVLANIVAYAQDDAKFVNSMTAWRDDRKDMNGNGGMSGAQGGAKLKLDWGNLVFKRPRLFLRLVLYIDLALSVGGPPSDGDFPAELQRSAA
ncbi:hypothetical protein CKM354_000957900 [Cercospora kikuchii]|uniref:Zn(2)-C6 fungal-type domain-containing protein n=1 Tax=Cercospora kikuchii TaxID=84275 RepID=A0A9P3CXT6_9PEZI|nr:uncharacterized protein CKM354_000957900 [Cercospora kikuchii]GIZ46453.1 hypothetical protein CKM354_000957900 [Cercospora kikuchii]